MQPAGRRIAPVANDGVVVLVRRVEEPILRIEPVGRHGGVQFVQRVGLATAGVHAGVARRGSVAEPGLQMLREADVEGLIGAGRHERAGERLSYRNGFRLQPRRMTRLDASAATSSASAPSSPNISAECSPQRGARRRSPPGVPDSRGVTACITVPLPASST